MTKALFLILLGAVGALVYRVRQLMKAVADLQEIERKRQNEPPLKVYGGGQVNTPDNLFIKDGVRYEVPESLKESWGA